MAQTIDDIEHFDFDSLSDTQLRELQSRIREIINRRVQSRLDESHFSPSSSFEQPCGRAEVGAQIALRLRLRALPTTAKGQCAARPRSFG
jgi:hypothetical protein